MTDIIFILTGILLFLFFAGICLKHGKPVKAAGLNMLGGAFFLTMSSVVLEMLGFSVMVNMFTVLISLTLGIPGVVFIIVHLIFM